MGMCGQEDETEKPESSSVIRASRGEKLQHCNIYGARLEGMVLSQILLQVRDLTEQQTGSPAWHGPVRRAAVLTDRVPTLSRACTREAGLVNMLFMLHDKER